MVMEMPASEKVCLILLSNSPAKVSEILVLQHERTINMLSIPTAENTLEYIKNKKHPTKYNKRHGKGSRCHL